MISVITACLSICLAYLYFAFVMDGRDDDRLSDDEVFYGKLSLREIKRMFIGNQNHRQTIGANEHKTDDDNNKSLQLISTHSEPDVTSKHTYIKSPEADPKALSYTTLSPDEPNIFATWDVTSSNNSFLKYEKLIEEACVSSDKKDFDNTLEEIEYILANTPGKTVDNKEPCASPSIKLEADEIGLKTIPKLKVNDIEQKCLNAASTVFTPVKQEKNVTEVFATPSSTVETKTPGLRTPANPPLFKKPSTSSLKKTPSKNNAFKHIASPVAYYINSTPQVPLIQNVYPKKPLLGSSIPKLVKPVVKPSNKENVILPPVAYKSAKKTTVIDVPNGPRMPQSPWAKKLTKSFPKPTVMKHVHREKELLNRSLHRKQEDSFGDLSLHQADISVCTKKAAF